MLFDGCVFEVLSFLVLSWGKNDLPCSEPEGLRSRLPLTLVSAVRSCVGLLEPFPDLTLEDGGGGGAGLDFVNFPLSFSR